MSITIKKDPLLSLVQLQFYVYGFMGFLGCLGWFLSLSYELTAPGLLGYVTNHLERWTLLRRVLWRLSPQIEKNS